MVDEARANADRLASEVDLERVQNRAHQARAEDYARQLEIERAQKQEYQSKGDGYAKQVATLDLEVQGLRIIIEQACVTSKHALAELEAARSRALEFEELLRNAEKQRSILEEELQEQRDLFAAEVRNVEEAIGETRA